MKEKPISCYGFSNRREFHVFCLISFFLLVLTGFLHFWKIGEIPNGFFVDESSIGYNAFCISETGADEYGVKYPVFFRCFDNYHEPVMIYLLAPMVKVFGLEKWVVRLPSAVFHILAAIAFFFMATKYARNRWICLGGAFVFSILPWVFPISRVMMSGYSAMLLGMTAGWYFLMKAVGGRSFHSAVLSGVCWAFAMYAHNIGRPMTAVILVCFVLALNVLLIKRWKVFAVFATSYVISLLPMIISVINHPESMTKRFSTLSVWTGSSGVMETASRIFERYLEYFSPAFLFISGDPILRHHTGASGELYIFMAPFIIAGIYLICKKSSGNPYLRFLLLGLIVYPLAAVVTTDHFHSTRAVDGSIFWSLTAVLGVSYIWKRRKVKTFKIMLYSFMVFSIYETTSYFVNYFGKYVENSRSDFLAPYVEVFEYSFKNLKPGETLYVSASVFLQRINVEFKPVWYSSLLFFGKVSPAEYQKAGIPGDYICAYQGRVNGGGILLRKNIINLRDETGRPVSVENSEVIPENSVLIHKIPVTPGSMDCIEIYRF